MKLKRMPPENEECKFTACNRPKMPASKQASIWLAGPLCEINLAMKKEE